MGVTDNGQACESPPVASSCVLGRRVRTSACSASSKGLFWPKNITSQARTQRAGQIPGQGRDGQDPPDHPELEGHSLFSFTHFCLRPQVLPATETFLTIWLLVCPTVPNQQNDLWAVRMREANLAIFSHDQRARMQDGSLPHPRTPDSMAGERALLSACVPAAPVVHWPLWIKEQVHREPERSCPCPRSDSKAMPSQSWEALS